MSPTVATAATATAALFAVLSLYSFAEAGLAFPRDSPQTGENCTMADGRVSVCKELKDCPEILPLVKAGKTITKCKSRPSTVAVCCPPSSSQQLFSSQQKDSPAKAKARDKCAEYAKYAWELKLPVVLLPGSEYINVSNCAFASEKLVFGGTDANPREFPHMALIGYGSGESFKWACGGSLISKRHILTAGHCLKIPGGLVPTVVRLGENDLTDSTESEHADFKIARMIKHPEYVPPARYNDIGILELDRDVQFNGTIRPACLYTEDVERKGNVTAAGWGRANPESLEGTNVLQKVNLPIQPPELCNKTLYRESDSRFLRMGIDARTMICAGAENGKDTCSGDSGGPLQIKDPDLNRCIYQIIGLTSFGQTNCGTAGNPAVYTRVSAYLPWIASIAWE